MNKKFVPFSRYLTRRIVLLLTLALMVLFAVLIYLTAKTSYNLQKSNFNSIMDVESEIVEGMLHGVEVSVNSNVSDIEHALASPDEVYKVLENKLANHPQLAYFFALFEPYYYPEKGQWFEPYVMRKGNSIIRKEGGFKDEDYHQLEEYKASPHSGSGYWSKPFEDIDAEGFLCSYMVPIHDATGRVVGAFGADVSLSWLQQQMREMDDKTNRKYIRRSNSQSRVYSFITTQDGTYLTHPDEERILEDKFTGFANTNKKVGVLDTELDGRKVFIYYEDVHHTGWTIGFVVPKRLVWMPVFIFAVIMLVTMALGLLAVAIISRITIYRSTIPLQTLARSADEVAEGNFNTPLPQVKNNNEIFQLRQSFGNMQQSLTHYIEELKSSTAENAAFENEMANARDIQMDIVPNQFPPYPERTDIDIYGMMEPAKSVGGDLFDFLIRDNSLFFCIGDVSGKGVPAALLMAVTRTLFHSISMEERRPDRIMFRINRTICEGNKNNMFVTMFIGILDLTTGHLDYCNAGHETPLLSGRPLSVKRNKPAGVLSDWEFEGQETQLQPGDMLFLYTDGLSEARNQEGKQLGRAYVTQLVNQQACDTARHQVEQIAQEVHRYAANTEQSDDLTLLAIKWNSGQWTVDSYDYSQGEGNGMQGQS